MTTVKPVYDKLADWFDQARAKSLTMEQKYLQLMVDTIPKNAHILDVGCGSGEPMAKYFIERGYSLLGIDNSETMISLCQQRFPNQQWLLMDMRKLTVDKRFDCVIAWHSFFHIPREEQEAVLSSMVNHLADDGLLVFTSGTENSEHWSNNGGEMLFHASLSTEDYHRILSDNRMEVILHNVSDPECGNATDPQQYFRTLG